MHKNLFFLLFIFSFSFSQTRNNALELFMARKYWKDLPPLLLINLSNRLKSSDHINEFIEICESSGILQNYIMGNYSDEITDLDILDIAKTLISYSNALGQEQKCAEAIKITTIVLYLFPRHPIAWMNMASSWFCLGDCKNAVFWAKKVIEFKANPNSTDLVEQSFVLYTSGEIDDISSLALGVQGGSWKDMQNTMNYLIKLCGNSK